jgi:hypothetical protein
MQVQNCGNSLHAQSKSEGSASVVCLSCLYLTNAKTTCTTVVTVNIPWKCSNTGEKM